MRPKLLEIEGLQSFCEAQTIDFESLSETGLFGIFGPTGSGKSTVLDAITLALYGKIKRAENGTQGIININRKNARVSFTFQLTIGGNKRLFKVERVYQRNKGTPNSSESKIARLIEITDGGEIPVCEKHNDVTNKIRELLGLNHEDFTRAVVLPQNSFQEFLLLNSSERRGMLERIFYLEEYGKQLWEKLGRKMSGLRSRIDTLSGELKGYEDASEEALLEAHKAMLEAAAERDRVLNDFKKQEAVFNEAKEVWALVQELSHVMEKESLHASLKDAMMEKKAVLERAAKANSLAEQIKKCRELDTRLNSTKNELDSILLSLPGVESGLSTVQAEHEELKRKFAHEQPQLIGKKARLEDALHLKAEMAALQHSIERLETDMNKIGVQLSQKSEALENETRKLKESEEAALKLAEKAETMKISPDYRIQVQEGLDLEKQKEKTELSLRELENKSALLKTAVEGLNRQYEKKREEIQGVLKELEALNELKEKRQREMPGSRAEITRKMERLHALNAQYEILCFHEKELGTLETRKSGQEAELRALADQEALLREALSRAEKYYEECRLSLDISLKEQENNLIRRLSMSLKEHEPCPVCGSLDHPKPFTHQNRKESDSSEEQINGAKEKLTLAEKELREVEKAVLLLTEKIRSLSSQNQQTLKELEQKKSEFEKEKAKLPEALRSMTLDSVRIELDRMNQIGTEKLKAIEEWEREQESLDGRIQKLNEEAGNLRISENGILSQLQVNRENLGQLEKSLSQAREQLNSAKGKYTEFLERLGLESATLEFKRISAMDQALHLLQEEMDKAQAEIDKKRAMIERIKAEVVSLNSENIRLDAELKGLQSQMNSQRARLLELAGDSVIENEIAIIDKKLQEYAEKDTLMQDRIQSLIRERNSLESRKALLINQHRIYSESLSKEESMLKSAMEEKGFKDVSEVEDAFLDDEAQKKIRMETEEYDREGINLMAQLTMLRRKLRDRSITEEEWAGISSAYDEIAAYKEECVSRSEVARNNYEAVRARHERWAQINREYKALTHKQGLFEQIQKVLRGDARKDNSFIDYVAEERLRYVAAKASQTLGVTTRYKYALELDAEMGFIIRDNMNGGICRNVSTLSGGETFLTSLSLALALSEQIQLKGQSPLEFFFLDEGFGTLDSELLDNVVDSLERLSRKERVIGIISHVPELKSRIGRRLIIEPPSSQGEGSRVKIEWA